VPFWPGRTRRWNSGYWPLTGIDSRADVVPRIRLLVRLHLRNVEIRQEHVGRAIERVCHHRAGTVIETERLLYAHAWKCTFQPSPVQFSLHKPCHTQSAPREITTADAETYGMFRTFTGKLLTAASSTLGSLWIQVGAWNPAEETGYQSPVAARCGVFLSTISAHFNRLVPCMGK